MVSTFPPTPTTYAGLTPNQDGSVNQTNDAARNTIAALIAAENALVSGVGVKKTYKYTFDFAVLGGAVSAIVMTAPDGALPNNFIVQNAFIDVITGFTGAANCELALSTGQGAGDLVASAVVTGAPWSTATREVTIPLLGTISTWIKTTAARSPVATITVAAVTAGKFNLFIEGYISA